MTSFADKKIISYSEFCDIKVYKIYKDSLVISRQKIGIVKPKDKLIEFGTTIYGKGVEFANYTNEFLYNKYKNKNRIKI